MRKSNRNTAVVQSGYLYTDDQWTGTKVDDLGWLMWVQLGKTFYFENGVSTFTARAELRRGGASWYAFKRVDGVLKKRYIGRGVITLDRLNQVSKLF